MIPAVFFAATFCPKFGNFAATFCPGAVNFGSAVLCAVFTKRKDQNRREFWPFSMVEHRGVEIATISHERVYCQRFFPYFWDIFEVVGFYVPCAWDKKCGQKCGIFLLVQDLPEYFLHGVTDDLQIFLGLMSVHAERVHAFRMSDDRLE